MCMGQRAIRAFLQDYPVIVADLAEAAKGEGDDASKASHTRVGITKFKFVAVCLVLVDSHASSAG